MRGARLAVRTWGRGPPLLLVHGGPGGSGRYWLRLSPSLAASRTLHAVDLRGHGLSQRRRPYTIRELALDLPALRERLAPAGCDILGHSFGAPVAIEAALADFGFRRLILVGGFASTPRMLAGRVGFGTKLALGARLAAWNVARLLGRGAPVRAFLRRLLARAAPLWEGPRTPPWLDDVLFESATDPMDAVVPLQGSLLRWTALRRLRAFDRPLLQIVGTADHLALPQTRAIERRVAGARTAVIEGAGHSPFLEAPAEFADALLAFLAAEAHADRMAS